jgi:hypothetical protein
MLASAPILPSALEFLGLLGERHDCISLLVEIRQRSLLVTFLDMFWLDDLTFLAFVRACAWQG